ncbi:MAG TPA: PA14 domain-containing protein [Planctomycetota bacterium]|nr:PA14 domain-containing protein [Planctomycetota bacterium]
MHLSRLFPMSVACILLAVAAAGADAAEEGLRARYYVGLQPSGAPMVERCDGTIDFDWGVGSPAPELPPDRFSICWTGWVVAPSTGTYVLTTRTDDGVRLWVGGRLLVDAWRDQPATEWSGSIALVEGVATPIRMHVYENGGLASARLFWQREGESRSVVPSSCLRSSPPPSVPSIPGASTTSPATITGEGWESVGVWADGASCAVARLGDRAFYAFAPLRADGPTAVTVSGPGGGASAHVTWEPTRVDTAFTRVLRRGDSLLLDADQTGIVTIVDPGGSAITHELAHDALFPVRFDASGRYAVRFTSADGSTESDAIAVSVRFPSPLAAQTEFERTAVAEVLPQDAPIVLTSSDDANAVVVDRGIVDGRRTFTVRPRTTDFAAVVARTPSGDIIAAEPIAAFSVEYNARYGLFSYDETMRTGLGSIIMKPWIKGLGLRLVAQSAEMTFAGGVRDLRLSTDDMEPGPYRGSGMLVYKMFNVSPQGFGCHRIFFSGPGGPSALPPSDMGPVAIPGADEWEAIVGESGLLNPGHLKLAIHVKDCSGARNCSWYSRAIAGIASDAARFAGRPAIDEQPMPAPAPLELERGAMRTVDSTSTPVQIAPNLAIARWRDSNFLGVDTRLGRIIAAQNLDRALLPNNENSIAFVFGNGDGSFFPVYLDWYVIWTFQDLGLATFNREPFRIVSRAPFDTIPPRFVTFTNHEDVDFFDVADPGGAPVWTLRPGMFIVFEKRDVILSGSLLRPRVVFVVADPDNLTADELEVIDIVASEGAQLEIVRPTDWAGSVPSLVIVSGTSEGFDPSPYAASPILTLRPDVYAALRLARRPGRSLSTGSVRISDNNHFATEGRPVGTYSSGAPLIVQSLDDDVGQGIGDLVIEAGPTDRWDRILRATKAGLRDVEQQTVPANRLFLGLPIAGSPFGLDAREIFRRSMLWTLQSSAIAARRPEEIRSGGWTLRIAISRDEFLPGVGTDPAQTSALLAGITSDDDGPSGWNATVAPVLRPEHVVRLGDRLLEVHVPAVPGYQIDEPESITVTIDERLLATRDQFPADVEYAISSEARVVILPDGAPDSAISGIRAVAKSRITVLPASSP